MKFKTALFALVTMGLIGGLTSSTACGKNDCEDAADRTVAKYEECGFTVETSDGDGGEEAECTDAAGEAAQKSAGCIEAADCAALDGSDLDAVTSLSECLTS